MQVVVTWFASLLVGVAGLPPAETGVAKQPGTQQPLCDGRASCQVDGFSVQSFGCGPDGLYGAMSASGTDGVKLNDRVDGKGRIVARLRDNQFVCVAATATAIRGGDPRYYVVAIPTKSVPACRHNALCEGKDLPIAWNSPTRGQACQPGGGGRYQGDCAAGWIDEGQLDQYSNGL